MRAILLAFVLSLFSSSLVQAGAPVERYPWLVTKAWYQLCGNNRFLAFDPQFSCCCFTQSTGKHCVRRNMTGTALNCIQICDASLCR
jgi:hypothetical protein